jgi:CMP-N,N'-diacetyllegionaminic acid synthase
MDKKLRICSICARGGSKGVKNKNIRLIGGKPLIIHTLEHALLSGLFTEIAVSSDSEEILNVAETFGIKNLIKRPDHLATDTSPKIPAIQHCIREVECKKNYKFSTIVDLDATSPLRSLEDISNAVRILESKNISNIITGTKSRRSPYFNLVELNENGTVTLSKKLDQSIQRRQDSPLCFDMNASIYVWEREAFFNSNSVFLNDTEIYVMPEERSIDIDTELDFEFVEFLLNKKK